MSDRDIVPKKQHSIILWLLIGIGLVTILFFLTRQPNKVAFNRSAATLTNTSSYAAKYKWNTINFNAPAANYNEITNRDIIVKGTNNYAIYSLKEELLFERNNSALRAEVIKTLHQIVNSIEQRYTNGLIRIYDHTTDADSNEINLQLTQQRIETVRNWLLQNSNISAGQITIQPIGSARLIDSYPIRESPQGKRHMDIVAIHTY